MNNQADKSAKVAESADKQKPILFQTQTHNTCTSMSNRGSQRHIPKILNYTSIAALNPLKATDKL